LAARAGGGTPTKNNSFFLFYFALDIIDKNPLKTGNRRKWQEMAGIKRIEAKRAINQDWRGFTGFAKVLR
jgi:hypothetical protein